MYGSLGGDTLSSAIRDHRGAPAPAASSPAAASSSSGIPTIALVAGAGLVAFLLYRKLKKA